MFLAQNLINLNCLSWEYIKNTLNKSISLSLSLVLNLNNLENILFQTASDLKILFHKTKRVYLYKILTFIFFCYIKTYFNFKGK